MTFDFFFLQFDLISSKDLEMSVFLHYFHEIFFLSNYHCVLYTTAIELLFARIRGHCALYWRPFSASLLSQRPRDFQSFPSMSKKNTQTSNHKFLLWQRLFTAISKIFANFLIIKIYTIMKQPWKFQQLQKISSSFFNVSRSVLFSVLLSCWEGVITNCSEIQQSLALRFIQFYVKVWFWIGAKPCRISAVHTCTIDRNLTHDATFRWALS